MRYDSAALSTAYSDALREQARAESELVRARLENGDFRVGDRISLIVESEPTMTDTFVVAANTELRLPVIGAISLQGVLRSELTDHLTRELGRYIREPSVQAMPLLRVGVIGTVGQQGFHMFPAPMLLSDALMSVGALGANVNLEGIEIKRSGTVIWKGEAVRRALQEGRTLDQLSLQAGDEIEVGQRRNFGIGSIGQSARALRWMVIGIPSLILAIARIF